MLRCAVCKQRTNQNKAHISIWYEGETYYLCCPLCQAEFEREPEKYIRALKKKLVHRR
ncbi:MAG: YHS domain-containing protein [bacterium]